MPRFDGRGRRLERMGNSRWGVALLVLHATPGKTRRHLEKRSCSYEHRQEGGPVVDDGGHGRVDESKRAQGDCDAVGYDDDAEILPNTGHGSFADLERLFESGETPVEQH